MHIHVYTPMCKQCTLAHTYVYHLSAPPFVVSKLDNPWVGTRSCDVDHVSSRVASASFHPVLFSIQLLCTHTHTHTHINHLPSPSPSVHAALSHLFFSPPLSHSPKVHRLPVEECSNFTDCSACITNGGLLCGWCSVENKCSRRPQCANSNSSDGLRWVQTTDRCLTVNIASAVSISGEETAYPRETSSIVSWV